MSNNNIYSIAINNIANKFPNVKDMETWKFRKAIKTGINTSVVYGVPILFIFGSLKILSFILEIIKFYLKI